MPKIILETDRINTFNGDAIFCFCDKDLANKKYNQLLQIIKYPNQEGYRDIVKSKILNNDKNNKSDLLKEIAAIGEINIGNAVVTNGYELNSKYFIFIPYINSSDPDDHITSTTFHQALRSSFLLASTYKLTRVAVPLLKIRIPKRTYFDKLLSLVFENKSPKVMTDDEILDITLAISKEFNNSSIKEVVIYK